MKFFNVPNLTVPEMIVPSDDAEIYINVLNSVSFNLLNRTGNTIGHTYVVSLLVSE